MNTDSLKAETQGGGGRLQGDVAAVIDVPNVEDVPGKEFRDSWDVTQRVERNVKVARRLGQVAFINQPDGGTNAQNIERQANRYPQRYALRSARKTRPVERRLHTGRMA